MKESCVFVAIIVIPLIIALVYFAVLYGIDNDYDYEE